MPVHKNLNRAYLFLALFAAGLPSSPFAHAQESDGDSGPPATLVRVDKVKLEPLHQTVPVIGRLVARQAGEVAARIAGPVEKFHVDVGDRVQRGDMIALLNSDILDARRELAIAAVSLSRAQLETNEEEMVLAEQELKRLERLKSSAAFSQARFDDLRQNVAIALRRVRQAQALVARAGAELQLSEIAISDTKIVAPYDGVITRRLTEQGAYVQIGAPVVYMIADQALEIEAAVPFDRLGGLSEGTELTFRLDDGTNHKATVRAVLPSENPLTRTRDVRFTPEFNGVRQSLANAQSVTVLVPAGPMREVLTVHKDAIIRRQGTTVVYLVKGDMAESRSITIGEGLGSRVEVIKGLAEGDQVVVRGNERLRPGTRIRINGAS